MKVGREIGWLREGYPVLPRFLREAWGDELLPSAVQHALGLPPTHLRDLDASVWNRLKETSRVPLLASYIRALTTSRLYVSRSVDAGAAGSRPIVGSALPLSLALGDLPFRNRTRNVLMIAGRLNDVAWASCVTASEYLGLKNAGVITLLDFAVVLEAHAIETSIALEDPPPVAVKVTALMESTEPRDQEMVVAQLEELIRHLRTEHNVENVSSRDLRLPASRLRGATIDA